MKEFKSGQRIKVDWHNEFHCTSTTSIATIVKFDSNYVYVSITPKTYRRIVKSLCGKHDCSCHKINFGRIPVMNNTIAFLDDIVIKRER